MFVDCIYVVFCRPLDLVTDFNAIFNACLAGVPSGSLKMCQINLSLFYFISPLMLPCHCIYISVFGMFG